MHNKSVKQQRETYVIIKKSSAIGKIIDNTASLKETHFDRSFSEIKEPNAFLS